MEKKKESLIKFYWGRSRLWICFFMVVKEVEIYFGLISEDEAENEAVKILKEKFSVEYDKTKIKWEWEKYKQKL